MKKAIVIILVLIVAGIGIAYYMTQVCEQKPVLPKTTAASGAAAQPTELLSYIPDTAAFCMTFSDIDELKTAIENSSYFKNLSSTSSWRTWAAVMEVQLQQALKNRGLEAGVEVEPPDLGLFWDLVGDEMAMAFLPGQEPDSWVLAFLARVKKPTRLKQIVKFIKDSATNEGFTLSDTDYKGESISKGIKADDKGEFYLCQTRGMLTASTSLQALKSVLDLISSSTKNSLVLSENYTSLAAKLRPGHLGEFFMKLGANMGSMFTSIANVDGLPTQGNMQGMPKMAGDSLTRLYIKDGLQFESYSALDVEKSDPKIVGFYKYEPNDLPLLSIVPQGSTMVFALNCLNAKAMYEMVIDSAMTQNPMVAVMVSGFITELEKKIGVSLAADILPAIGPDVTFYYKGLSFKQALSLPELGFACSSKNPGKLYNVFPKVGDHLLSFAQDKAPEAKHVEEVYKGHPVHEIRVAMPICEMSLAAAVVDEYFCIGFGREQVNMMIDCLAGDHPQLKNQSEYTAISAGFPKAANQIMYLDSESLWRQIKSALEVYTQLAKPESKDAFEFVDALLKPMKTAFTASVYEHPSESVAAQRSYGHVKIEAE